MENSWDVVPALPKFSTQRTHTQEATGEGQGWQRESAQCSIAGQKWRGARTLTIVETGTPYGVVWLTML